MSRRGAFVAAHRVAVAETAASESWPQQRQDPHCAPPHEYYELCRLPLRGRPSAACYDTVQMRFDMRTLQHRRFSEVLVQDSWSLSRCFIRLPLHRTTDHDLLRHKVVHAAAHPYKVWHGIARPVANSWVCLCTCFSWFPVDVLLLAVVRAFMQAPVDTA